MKKEVAASELLKIVVVVTEIMINQVVANEISGNVL